MITPLRQSFSLLRYNNSSFLPRCKSHLDLLCPFALHLHFSTSTPNPTIYEFLVHTHQFSPKPASHIASVLTCLRNPDKSDSILSFFKESGFSTSQLERVFRVRPSLLSANLDKVIKPKFKILFDLGLPASDVVQIITKNPNILGRRLHNRVIPNLSLLKNLLGSGDKLARFLNMTNRSLLLNLDNSLIPNVELFTKCGVSMDQILSMMHHFPRFMLRGHQAMKKLVARADAMGVSRSSKTFIHAVRVINSMSEETWELKLRSFRGLGFSDDDIATIFRRFPFASSLSAEKIKTIKELLLATGKYKLSDIISNPASLGYSIEKRYKPRLQVLELLESKNLIQSWPTLGTLCICKDEKFYVKFVAPFVDEIGEHAYMKKVKGKGAAANLK